MYMYLTSSSLAPALLRSVSIRWVFLITFGSYFMSHFSRKCYSTVKKQLSDDAGYTSTTLSEMDTTFMATYAIGE